MMESAHGLLREIQVLLARYRYDGSASLVERTINTVDPTTFWEMVSGLEFWGGAGAVWEVEPFSTSHPDSPTAIEDYLRFQVLMIELADLLGARGLAALAARNAAYFRRQLDEWAYPRSADS